MSSAQSQEMQIRQIVRETLQMATVVATKNGAEIFKMVARAGLPFTIEELQPIHKELEKRMGEGCKVTYEFETSTQLDN
ncbi:hypothetical protein [Pseudanabaena sp. FACHB-2040]|uniref:hypothetical protein n=1 Tax=Pseudanabaena sp. FACHB-2040 TaxID=2692859 RepID=UPI0016855FE9|nr:hypothetical protein [Pseudanabaena sp. FACHB-2040]MBD2256672.1 hypothetical protein [Pseudanabaena sp. FACHB-2040]